MDIMVTKMEEFALNVTFNVNFVMDIQTVIVIIVKLVGSLMDILVLKFVQQVNTPNKIPEPVNLVITLVKPVLEVVLTIVLLVPLQNSGITILVLTHVQMDILELLQVPETEFVLSVLLPV